MFIWTSIAYMALALGEVGIAEIPNESAVLNAMQSGSPNKIGLYIFPVSALAKTQLARQERGE